MLIKYRYHVYAWPTRRGRPRKFKSYAGAICYVWWMRSFGGGELFYDIHDMETGRVYSP